MAKTNLQRQASYYERIIKEAKKSSHSPKYQKICMALEGLVKISNRLKGSDHKMSQKEHEILIKSYENVQKACQTYLKGSASFNDFEKEREKIIKDIGNVLAKDMRVLKEYNPKEPMSLSEVMEKSRTRKVVLKSKGQQKVGGALSSRIPLRTNSGKKGFFTPISIYDPDKEWRETLAKFEVKFGSVSEKCKKQLELLKTDEDFQMKICNHIPEEPIKKNERYYGDAKKQISSIAHLLGIAEDGSSFKQLLKKDKTLYDELFAFINSAVNLANKQIIMQEAGIKKGANISNRNCAMTDVAKMLDCGHLLANSEPMKIELDGEEIEGVFMETAEGTDLNRLEEEDIIFDATPASFENPAALQQILDLQVLDFVCGNTDRHIGNMTYQFKKGFFGDVKFVGIKGIDNDCSFGTPKVTRGSSIMKMVNPENMKYITPKMVKKLDSLDKNFLELKLAHLGLSQDEIDAAWDRVELVKDDVKHQRIKIVDNSFWIRNELWRNKSVGNYISRIQGVQRSCSEDSNILDKYLEEQMEKGITSVKYIQETVTAAEIMAKNDSSIENLRKQMNDAKARIYNSSEYNMMENRFKKIENLTKEVKSYENPEMVPEKTIEALRKAYIELAERTEKYIALKKIVPSSTRGEKRLELAKALREFSIEFMEKLGVKFEKEEKEEKATVKAEEKEIDDPIEEVELTLE